MFRYFLFLVHSQNKPPLEGVVIVFLVLMATFLVSLGQVGLVVSSSLAFLVTLLFYSRYLIHWVRFGISVRGFRLLAGKGVVLRYAPDLQERGELAFILLQCEESLHEFNERFGFPLKRELVVFLFPTPAHLGRLFKMWAEAAALIGGDAIILTWVRRKNNYQEDIRHELAHLFSYYWGRLNPPLKGEGLATWLQGNLHGKPVDMQALALLLTDRFSYLSWILDTAVFYGTHWYGYTLAGSFTGFLIRQFGWDSYGSFFQQSNDRNFRTIFQQAFGLTLVTAERQWRQELLCQRQCFEPEISELIRKRNLEAAFNAWQFYRCVELADELFRGGQADINAMRIAARSHAMLGNYERAAEVMKQVVQNDEPSFHGNPSGAWLFLGELYDLLGRREEAISAYQQCLILPDEVVFSVKLSIHGLARRRLKYPMTEKEWLERITPGPWQPARRT